MAEPTQEPGPGGLSSPPPRQDDLPLHSLGQVFLEESNSVPKRSSDGLEMLGLGVASDNPRDEFRRLVVFV